MFVCSGVYTATYTRCRLCTPVRLYSSLLYCSITAVVLYCSVRLVGLAHVQLLVPVTVRATIVSLPTVVAALAAMCEIPKFTVRCTSRLLICSGVPLYSRTVLRRAQTSEVSLQSARSCFQKHGRAVPPYVAAYAYEIPTTWQHTVPYQ